MHRILMAMALLFPLALASGCLSAGDAPVDDADARGGDNATVDAETTTASTAPATPITAPKQAYRAENGGDAADVHPFVVPGQEARDAEHFTFEGAYGPEDCVAPIVWEIAGDRSQGYSFMDALQPGDAVMATVTLTFENTDQNFADLHVWAAVPGQYHQHTTSVGEERGTITQTLDFQFGFRGGKDAYALAGVSCWWAANAEPIPYTIDVHLRFAEGVVPAGNPVLVNVDEGVSELRVTGARANPDTPATGHYRVFTPDDRLLGEFALNSDEAADVVTLPGPGAYVVIVDHSEDGMLALGADAPPADPELEILELDWARYVDYAQDEVGPAAANVELDVPRVPLNTYLWVRAADGDAGGGRAVTLDLTGPEGRVYHIRIPSFVNARPPSWNGGPWFSVPDAEGWAWEYDHHALARGAHTLSVNADSFRGEVVRYVVSYLRPGETGLPAPAGGDDEGSAVAGAGIPLPAA